MLSGRYKIHKFSRDISGGIFDLWFSFRNDKKGIN